MMYIFLFYLFFYLDEMFFYFLPMKLLIKLKENKKYLSFFIGQNWIQKMRNSLKIYKIFKYWQNIKNLIDLDKWK